LYINTIFIDQHNITRGLNPYIQSSYSTHNSNNSNNINSNINSNSNSNNNSNNSNNITTNTITSLDIYFIEWFAHSLAPLARLRYWKQLYDNSQCIKFLIDYYKNTLVGVKRIEYEIDLIINITVAVNTIILPLLSTPTRLAALLYEGLYEINSRRLLSPLPYPKG